MFIKIFTLFLFFIKLNLYFSKDNKDKILIIIRHGEKISDDYTDLSPRGKARAECLPNLFSDSGLKYIPTKLYSNKRNENTTRAYDTIVPLSKALKLEIEEFEKSQAEYFANTTLRNDDHDIILVSSTHGIIPKITEILGHEVIISEEEFDKFFIWKNGEFSYEGKQSDFIGKCIEDHLNSFFLKKNFFKILIYLLFIFLSS